MAAQDQPDQTQANTRKRIIETAQLNCYDARSQCLRAKSRAGFVPRDYRLAFQDAILDYYWALKPLREENAVNEWWESVTLSTDLEGLDEIDTLDEQTEVVKDHSTSIRGEQSTRYERQHVLSFNKLKQISGVLDDAAGKLGFNPESPSTVPRTEITKEDLEKMEEWRQQHAQ